MNAHESLLSGRASQQALTLLVADVLAFTPPENWTEASARLLSDALKRTLHSDCSQADEEHFFEAFLDAGLTVTAPFNPELLP